MNEPTARQWRSFWGLIGMQTMNAFNDNFTKFLLIPLGVALYHAGLAFHGVEHLLGALLVLPFILFAPSAGWLGDRFAKYRVIRWASWMQMGVIVTMIGALFYGDQSGATEAKWALGLTLAAFFVLATQSALLSPAKMGVVKELVGSQKLGFANGVMEGTVILAILGGQMIGGLWFDQWGLAKGKGPWEAAYDPLLWILIGAVISLIFAYQIQPTQAKGAENFSSAVAFRHFGDLKKLKAQKGLWRATLGIAFFWSFGGFLQLLVIQIADEATGGTVGMGKETAMLWAPVVVGIVVGSLLTSMVCRRQNELGLVVIGGAVMAVASLILACSGTSWISLGLSGFGGAMFLVPLNAYLQDGAKEKERGLVISASNLCINLGGIIAVGVQFMMKLVGVPVSLQFLLVAGCCAVVTGYVARLLPKDFFRLIVLGIFRSIYRVRALQAEKIPSEGGVLLVANHLSYIDGIILSIACPRPIRFLMFDTCFDRPWIGKFARIFEMVPVSPAKAKDAIRVAAETLKDGDVVCIFPEGQLSRTGGLAEIKMGYRMIARKAGVPVVAAYMDGLWGSMWSFEGRQFLGKGPRKIPYGVSVAFRELGLQNTDLQENLHHLSVITTQDRAEQMETMMPSEPEIFTDLPRGWNEMYEKAWADHDAGFEMRANALQLSQVNLAERKERILVEWNGEDEVSGILGVLWPKLIDAQVAFAEQGEAQILSLVSRERISLVILRESRKELEMKLRGKGIRILVINGMASERQKTLLVKNGRVLAYSIAHPDYETTTMMPQAGWMKNSLGKLLPGFAAEEIEGGIRLSGPALQDALFIAGFAVGRESFILPQER